MGGELDSMVSDPTDLPENPNKAECTTVARSLPVICKMFGKKSCVAFNSKMSAKCGGNAAFNIEDGNEDVGEDGKEDDEEMASSDDNHALADEDEDDSSVRVGRRGGAGLMTSGSFVLMSANRAGNDEEEELGEEDAGKGGKGGPGKCHKLCKMLPKLRTFNPGSQSDCKYAPCYDGNTGKLLGDKQPYATTDKTVCSRICLLGGGLTRVKNLERYDNPETSTGNRKVDAKFGNVRGGGNKFGKVLISEPVCGLHKTVMCTKNKEFDLVKCQEFMEKKAGGESPHCKKENCTVQKNVHCVAILPAFPLEVPAILSAQYNASLAFMDDIKTTSGRRAYKDECKYAINPCDPVALYV